MVNQLKLIAWIRESSCIRCTSHALNGNGYPQIYRGGKKNTIARNILLRRHGDIPSRLIARHTCDNRWCIRPDHIVIGTMSDNNRDRKERGRNADTLGCNNPNVKLTPDQVIQIRESCELKRDIAKRFGISISGVEKIRARKYWRHI